MATLVCFHAHPDDESIATGGTMAKAAHQGHRVILVTATRGEQGEPVPGVLAEGEALWERRVVETQQSADILGAEAALFLGYEDSGMMGEATNDNPDCFWQADVDEAAGRLATILRDVGADVLTVYDDHGGYGHPDHIQVHRVGHAAARLAGVTEVFEATMNRTHIAELMEQMPLDEGEQLEEVMDEESRERTTSEDFGTPEDQITHAVDVTGFLLEKRASMKAHASQIGDDSFFLKMPDEAFIAAFGTEWFLRPGHTRGPDEPFGDDLFAGLG